MDHVFEDIGGVAGVRHGAHQEERRRVRRPPVRFALEGVQLNAKTRRRHLPPELFADVPSLPGEQQRERHAVRMAGLGQQPPGAVGIVRQFGQFGIEAEHRLGHVLIGRGAVAVAQLEHQRRTIDGQGHGAADADVLERLHPGVHAQITDQQTAVTDDLHARDGPGREGGRGGGGDVRSHVGRPVTQKGFHVIRALESDEPRGGEFGPPAPVGVVCGQAELVARDFVDQAIRAGADGIAGERHLTQPLVRALGHDEDGAQPVEQHRVGPGGGEADRVVVDAGDGGDDGAVAVPDGIRIVPRAQDGEDHVIGGQGTAVVEHHTAAQPKLPGEQIGVLPARRQQGHHLHVAIEAGQPLEQVGLNHGGDGLGAAVGHQRQRHAAQGDHHLGFLRWRRGAARGERQHCQQRQPSEPAGECSCGSRHDPVPDAMRSDLPTDELNQL